MEDLSIKKEDVKLALLNMIRGEEGGLLAELMANFFSNVIKVGVKEESGVGKNTRSIYFVLAQEANLPQKKSVEYYRENYAIKKENLEKLRDIWPDDTSAEEFLKTRKK